MDQVAFVLALEDFEEGDELSALAMCELSEELHPEDRFIAEFLSWSRWHAKSGDAWPRLARALAQAALDQVGLEGDFAALELHALLARSVTLSVQARISQRGRAQLIREFRAFLRVHGCVPSPETQALRTARTPRTRLSATAA